MIRINVAPETVIQASSAAILRSLFIAVVCLVVCYYLPQYYAETVSTGAAEFQQKTTDKKNQLARLKLDVSKAKSLQEKLAELKARASQIRALSNGRKQPVFILDKLQQNHLERMWFEGLKMQKGRVSISGIALDHTIISEYVRRLKNMDADDELELSNIREFVPPFMKEKSDKIETVDEVRNVMPLRLTAVHLKKSTAEVVDGVTLQKFEAEFETGLP